MDESKTVWIGNLSNKVTEELLFELFLQVAPLEKVRIPTDKEGRQSNFAFVTFKHEQSVEYAVRLLNGIKMYDKNLNIKPKNPSAMTQNHFPERNFSHENQYGHMNNQNQFYNNERDNRQNRHNFRDRDNYRDDRYRDNPYSRHDDRDRYDHNRQKQHYNERRGNFDGRGNNRRNNSSDGRYFANQ
ncbi:RNA-binding protein 7 isoform X1 [Diabrotica virgifera virgifera]|uniref:RRM domain-containing protein n=2 Tax=Diabrotica virgifera virgifera TaxID=50390 RepID=A0ABM5KBP3_DIAVI|nr:RNA-binding protein 7 isoform X1 [Diabrotica virgifera virgifera]